MYMRKGDAIAAFAQPVAKGFDAVFGTDVQNCPACKQTQTNLNNGMSLADAFFDRFWPKDQQQTKKEN